MLSVLFGDDLVARVDVRKDKNRVISVLRFWLEEQKDAKDLRLARAFGRALARLGRMNRIDRIEARAMKLESFRRAMLKYGG